MGTCGPDRKASLLERHERLLLLVFFIFFFSYFFQGGGWNQNCHFDTARAIAERGTLDITPYAGNTGDICTYSGRSFSNKPPGLGLLGAPVYFLVYRVERALGLDPASPYAIAAKAHIVTFWVSGLPAALLVIAMHHFFRGRGVAVANRLLLASAFGLGTVLLPYSGVMMIHNLVAMCLFVAWLLIGHSRPDRLNTALAGAVLGLAMVTEYLTIPLVVLYLVFARWKSGDTRSWLPVLCGPAVAGLAILVCNYWAFGSPWTSIYSIYPAKFTGEGLFMGVLDWPDLRRLYWLSLHPYRGLLYCCPVFIVSLVGLSLALKSRSLDLAGWFAIVVCGYFLLFNLTFNGWTGGWGVGPRHLTPAMPFLFAFTYLGLRKFALPARMLMVLSVFLMVAVSSVSVMIPAENFGPPLDINPVRWALSVLFQGHVSVSMQSILEYQPSVAVPGGIPDFWDSYNLGEVPGLRGWASLIPFLLILCLFCGLCWILARRSAAGAGAAISK